MAKKSSALLLALLLAFILTGTALENAKVHTSGDYEYTMDSSEPQGIMITAYYGKEADLEIPEFLDGYPVVSLGEKVFQGNTSLKTVRIPDSVLSIGPLAFSQCYSMKTLLLGGKVKFIRRYAFNRCDSLESLIFPDSVESVETGALSWCKALQSVTIGRGLEHFYGSNPFVGSLSLKKIILPPDHPTLYQKDSMLFEKAEKGNTLVCCLPAAAEGEMDIPVGTRCIGNDACNSCSGVTFVRIPDGVVEIGATSFANNPNLTSILLPSGVTFIGGGAFAGTGITDIVIPEGVKILEHAVLADSRNLKEVTLPESLEQINDYAFSGCVSLTSQSIPKGVKNFGEGVFDQCPAILNVYTGSPAEEYCIKLGIPFERLFGNKVEF